MTCKANSSLLGADKAGMNLDVFEVLRAAMQHARSSRLSWNAGLATLQAIVGMVCMFVGYRVLIDSVGMEKMGLWTLLLAGVSVIRMVDVSGAGGLARFVAEERAKKGDASIYVHTVLLTTAGLYVLLALIVYGVSDLIISRFVEQRWAVEARILLPFAIGSTLITAPLATTLSSGVDGLRRTDQRALLIIGSYLGFLALVVLSVPRFGALAWGVALILQQIVIIVGSWLLLRRSLPNLGYMPYRWSTSVFCATVGYGAKLQAGAMATMLSEPLAKIMIAHFGGLASVAVYELASRLVTSLRGIVVQAAIPLVAEFASLRWEQERRERLLARSVRIAAFASLALFVGCAVAAPFFSLAMLGSMQEELILIILALGLGFAVNTLAVPHYLSGLGLNILRWNILSHALIAASIVVLGSLLGMQFGAYGVVVAMMVGLMGTAPIIMLGNGRALAEIDQQKYD